MHILLTWYFLKLCVLHPVPIWLEYLVLQTLSNAFKRPKCDKNAYKMLPTLAKIALCIKTRRFDMFANKTTIIPSSNKVNARCIGKHTAFNNEKTQT